MIQGLVADPTRANQILNWEPNLSDLDNIIKTAYEWHKIDSSIGYATFDFFKANSLSLLLARLLLINILSFRYNKL